MPCGLRFRSTFSRTTPRWFSVRSWAPSHTSIMTVISAHSVSPLLNSTDAPGSSSKRPVWNFKNSSFLRRYFFAARECGTRERWPNGCWLRLVQANPAPLAPRRNLKVPGWRPQRCIWTRLRIWTWGGWSPHRLFESLNYYRGRRFCWAFLWTLFDRNIQSDQMMHFCSRVSR